MTYVFASITTHSGTNERMNDEYNKKMRRQQQQSCHSSQLVLPLLVVDSLHRGVSLLPYQTS